MSPAVKYTLGRLGLFLVVLAALWPVELNLFVKLLVALAFSATASFFLLRRWRDETAEQWAGSAARRRAEKDRLRSALAGDPGPAGAGDGGPADSRPVGEDDDGSSPGRR
ncbi:DUF4229 domain-containing protein [Micromonospora zhanjiangensis]|uniref:DUF4229 domain-containing protein n=1 Tax=Micromonospora zhanjiangensis TaxID=1522057 RepID=A0ABV8KS07_9ACTN